MQYTLYGKPLTRYLQQEIQEEIEYGGWKPEVFAQRLAIVDSANPQVPTQQVEMLLHPGSMWMDDENWLAFFNEVAPKNPPTPRISDFKLGVFQNAFYNCNHPDKLILGIHQHWIEWVDDKGNKVSPRTRRAWMGSWVYDTDAWDSYLKFQWMFTADDGTREECKMYEIGFAPSDMERYYIPAKTGFLQLRFVDFAVSKYGDTVNTPWSEPVRLTHGYQAMDDPWAPNSILLEGPYIPIERLAGRGPLG